MATNLMASAVTFKKCTLEKLIFIILNLMDLSLTVFAVSHGAYELNPLMRSLLESPYQMYLIKLIIPVFLAWLIPGKLLMPSIAVLVLIMGWDIRELCQLSF